MQAAGSLWGMASREGKAWEAGRGSSKLKWGQGLCAAEVGSFERCRHAAEVAQSWPQLGALSFAEQAAAWPATVAAVALGSAGTAP